MKNTIRQIYFYAATLVFLIMSVIAMISLLHLGLKTYVFPKAELVYDSCPQRPLIGIDGPDGRAMITAEEQAAQQALCEKNQAAQRQAQRQNDFAQNFAMLVVAAPLFWLHFKWVQKERETELAMTKDEKKA